MERPRSAVDRSNSPRPRRAMTAPVSTPVSTPVSASTSSQQQQQQQSRPSSPSSFSPSFSPSPSPASRPGTATAATAAAAAGGPEELVETLYSHPSVRIISFTSSRRGFTTSLPASDNNVPPGSLPPSSHLERTIAVGAFRIYRAPGSVAFLSCGSALQPILPKSQCWCINEDNSRFVLQIRRPQYWRIEVPVADPDDAHRAVLLRDIFDKILLFEKTECPFERSFTVELPDPPETPVKKKAWTAEGKNLISSPFESDLSPPAHEPRAISRGQLSYDMSPASIMLDEGPDGLILGPRRQYLEDDVSHTKAHLVTNIPDGIVPVRSEQFSGCDDDGSIGPLKRAGTTWSGNIRRDSIAPSIPSSPPTSPEALHLLEVSTPDSSLAEVEELREETFGHSTENSPAKWAAFKKGNRIHQHSGSPFFDEQEEDEPETAIHHARETRGSAGVSFEGSGRVAPVNLTRKRMTRMLAGRSFAAPPPSAPVYSPSRSNEPVTGRKESQPPPSLTGVQSSSASTDSFHSVQSWRSSVTPPLAPPHPGDSPSNIESVDLPESSPAADSSDHVTTPKNVADVVTSSSVSDSCGNVESASQPARFITDKRSKKSVDSEGGLGASRLFPVEDKLRLRGRRSNALSISRRALSPLPPASNLFTPPPRQTSQSRLAALRRLPVTIIHKTMELLLGPPIHLIKLMLKVAAMIVAGEWRGLVFGFSETGERIPVQWDYYSDDEFSDLSDSDDYAIPIHNSNYSDRVPRAGVRRRTKWANDDDYASSVD
ncbi:inheritance of peroxisomes protein 1-domain-containing protein [Xylaria cf. heliscus]|nr:inheritance of peroxisomes protein 1-domain-containing protein [Xylaria cf. heliscus]